MFSLVFNILLNLDINGSLLGLSIQVSQLCFIFNDFRVKYSSKMNRLAFHFDCR